MRSATIKTVKQEFKDIPISGKDRDETQFWKDFYEVDKMVSFSLIDLFVDLQADSRVFEKELKNFEEENEENKEIEEKQEEQNKVSTSTDKENKRSQNSDVVRPVIQQKRSNSSDVVRLKKNRKMRKYKTNSSHFPMASATVFPECIKNQTKVKTPRIKKLSSINEKLNKKEKKKNKKNKIKDKICAR